MSAFVRLAGLWMVPMGLPGLVKTRLSASPSPHQPLTAALAEPTLNVPRGMREHIQQRYKSTLERAAQPSARERSEP